VGQRDLTKLRFPSKAAQIEKFGPRFDRLRNVLSHGGAAQLRTDPQSLAPDRVIVFEVAGTVPNFLSAVSRIKGFEFMGEFDDDFPPEEEFAVIDGRAAKQGQVRLDKRVPERFYLAMPDTQALEQLVRLWEIWKKTRKLEGYAPFVNLFLQLRDLRPWGPKDRIPPETVAYWQEELTLHPNQPIRVEVELWYRESPYRRKNALKQLRTKVEEAGGQIIGKPLEISYIAYHGALFEVPASEIEGLISGQEVKLAIADEVMFLRPQSEFRGPLQIEPEAGELVDKIGASRIEGQPIAALLDGMPMQAHALLDGRLDLDDFDDIQSRATVSRRVHGTAMASLILHGDRNEKGPQLSRPLYVRPVMVTDENGPEHTDPDRLLIDIIYQAVVRIKGNTEKPGRAPSVFLVNLSMGDLRRPFTRWMSPLARLLDFLAERYNVLFLVSGGNVTIPLDIPGFKGWSGFQDASPSDRQRAVLQALNESKHERTILSPAESLNALTVGAQHHDLVENRIGSGNVVDPLEDNRLPNMSSGLGLGYRRMIKPEVYFPAGREYVRMQRAGEALTVAVASPQRLYGLSAAAPDMAGLGRINYLALCDGTSSATALATRAAHRIFEAVVDRQSGSHLADTPTEFFPVLIKALLVHSARWGGNSELLKEICGPAEGPRFVERSENVARFVGFGVPDAEKSLECAFNRATFVGVASLRPNGAHEFRIPLPQCLEGVTDPRTVTVTVAWLSEVNPAHRNYRGVRIEAEPVDPVNALGVKRRGAQPADVLTRRGSVFHEEYEGEFAVPFIDDGHVSFRVWCKEDAGARSERSVRYAIAVTIESGASLPIYDQIKEKLFIPVRP
jgi:hypothetical protein